MSVEFKFTGDADQLLKEYDKLHKKVDQLEERLRRQAGSSRRRNQEERSGIEGVVSSIQGWAASYLSIQGAIRLTTQLLTAQRDAARDAANANRKSEFSLASLGVFDNFQELVQMSKDMHARGVGTDLNEAAQFVNALAATDMLEHKEVFADVASSGLIRDVGPVAEAAMALMQSLGKEETGDMRQLLSKMIHAGAIAPGGPQDVALAAAASGGSARQLGLTDEELFAAVSVAGLSAGSASEGGTQIAAFLKTLEMKGMGGKSLRESVLEIDAMGLEGEDAFKFFGRIEGIRGYRALSANLDQLDRFTGEITQAAADDLVGQRVEAVRDDPNLKASRKQRVAEVKEQASRENLGSVTQLADEVQSAMLTNLRKKGEFELDVQTNRAGANLERFFHGDETFVRRYAKYAEDPEDTLQTLERIVGNEAASRAAEQAVEVLKTIEKKLDARPSQKVVVRASAGLNVHQE